MTRLSVNVNKVALLRNTRGHGVPSVRDAARTCIDAGAHGITVHPRPDHRHITPQDVLGLASLVADEPGVEFNIEGNPFEGDWLKLVLQARPTQVTLVPDLPDQRTSDHGWDVSLEHGRLAEVTASLRAASIRVSLFMDPAPRQIEKLEGISADRIELYTEMYARTCRAGNYAESLQIYREAADQAHFMRLELNAGHDLNCKNLGPLLRTIPGILEVSIGHELIADALWHGLAATVKSYLSAIQGL